jgi:hypothetical protein
MAKQEIYLRMLNFACKGMDLFFRQKTKFTMIEVRFYDYAQNG